MPAKASTAAGFRSASRLRSASVRDGSASALAISAGVAEAAPASATSPATASDPALMNDRMFMLFSCPIGPCSPPRGGGRSEVGYSAPARPARAWVQAAGVFVRQANLLVQLPGSGTAPWGPQPHGSGTAEAHALS